MTSAPKKKESPEAPPDASHKDESTASELTDRTSVLGHDEGTLEEQRKKAQASDACLVLISGKPLGRTYPLKAGLNTVGRDATNDIAIDDKYASGVHGQFTLQQDRVHYEDLNSSNGSYIAEQPIQKGVLLDGEHIRIGKTVLKYLAKGNAENIYAGKMFDLANIDGLTQIFNKKYFVEELEKEFKRCRVRGGRFCLLMFDIDHFKKVNDTFGHPAGDYVLKHACEVLRDSVLRHRDIFARYGGEEFILLLFDTTPEKACQVAERMRQTIESATFEHGGQKIPITISLGVGMYSHQLPETKDLIEQTDQNLYRAKTSGRNRVCFS